MRLGKHFAVAFLILIFLVATAVAPAALTAAAAAGLMGAVAQQEALAVSPLFLAETAPAGST